MSPSRKAGGRGDEEELRPDETQEYELGDEFHEQLEEPAEYLEAEQLEEPDDAELADDDHSEQELDDQGVDDDGAEEDHEQEDHDEGQDEDLPAEDELERVVSAETQEWEGLEAAEAESERDEPTLVASAAQRVRRTGSSITSGFEKVGKKTTSGFKAVGQKTTSGFKAVRRRVGFPIWLRFL
ncbi:MAG TPA: hypothetical protein VE800_01830, partial [Actinomycetota bacterium]|nr:hypothetical protein [Actinomycetota bacterium]